ncbi:MAG: signal peptidase II [Acidimicrobiia bacterium]|jgi:signal peptidase II|nr:signal peptidase II [Acidimicrobiia bacterium]
MTRRPGGPLTVAASVVVLDQLTKYWALNALDDGRVIDLFWTLRFNLAFNTGMAFSRGGSFGPVIGVVALIIVAVIVLSLGNTSTRVGALAAGLLIGGALGNIIDRMFRDDGWFRGAVVDFIDPQWFPIFNVADIGVTVGGALLVLIHLLDARPSSGSTSS